MLFERRFEIRDFKTKDFFDFESFFKTNPFKGAKSDHLVLGFSWEFKQRYHKYNKLIFLTLSDIYRLDNI